MKLVSQFKLDTDEDSILLRKMREATNRMGGLIERFIQRGLYVPPDEVKDIRLAFWKEYNKIFGQGADTFSIDTVKGFWQKWSDVIAFSKSEYETELLPKEYTEAVRQQVEALKDAMIEFAHEVQTVSPVNIHLPLPE